MKVVIANFLIKNKVVKFKYFKKIFFIAKIKVEIIFIIFFFKFNHANILFQNQTIIYKSYIRNKALFIIT